MKKTISQQPKISIVIVNWNVAPSLVACLESVSNTDYPNLEVVVIDNASTDGSIKLINSFKSLEISLIKNSVNVGFPKAINQGLRKSTGDYILLLNPDARIPKNFFIEAIGFFDTHPSAALMGPKLLNSDGSPQGSVFREPSISSTIQEFWLGKKGSTAKYIPDEIRPVIVDAVSGACMFFPKRTLNYIGFLTEAVFMYFEDLDYCRRIRKSGLRVYFNPQISVIHEHGASSTLTSQTKYRNFVESLIYPFRKLFHLPNQNPSSQKYQTEAGIWYNGWAKHTLMAAIIWSGQKLRLYKT